MKNYEKIHNVIIFIIPLLIYTSSFAAQFPKEIEGNWCPFLKKGRSYPSDIGGFTPEIKGETFDLGISVGICKAQEMHTTNESFTARLKCSESKELYDLIYRNQIISFEGREYRKCKGGKIVPIYH